MGQNLAYGQQNWNDAVTAWHNEISNFTYTKGGGAAKKTVGHFTQVSALCVSHIIIAFHEVQTLCLEYVYRIQ